MKHPSTKELFITLRLPVYRLCLRICGNNADAEDAVQETFIEVDRSIASFRGDARLSTWVYRIAIRTSIRLRSRLRRSHVRDDRVEGETVEATAPSSVDAKDLRTGLEKISAEQRTVLALFALDDLSHAEIAAILGVPEGTVWSRLHNARKALIRELEK